MSLGEDSSSRTVLRPKRLEAVDVVLHPIALLHATRGRVSGAIAARDRWVQAAEFPERIEHIFAFDRDDAKSVAGLDAYRHVVVEQRDQGCVAAWNLAARASKGQILIQLSDDWLPIRHWDTKIEGRFRDVSKPGVLRVSDGRRVDDLLAFAIFTRAYLELIGGDFLAPEYFGVYSDDEFSLRAYQNGAVIDARDIVFEHCHPSFAEGAVYDETHKRQNDDARYCEGRKIFLRRNPTARGHWLHEGTEQRYYLPPGHFYAQNIVGPSVPSPSPLGRILPYSTCLPQDFTYQIGDRSALPRSKRSLLRRVANRFLGSIQAGIRRWNQSAFQSTLWTAKKEPFDTAAVSANWDENIPVFIVHYDQPDYLERMVSQLLRLGVKERDIVILDNASVGIDSLALLEKICATGTKVERLERNFGPHEIFAPESGVKWPRIFALTDPDLEFDPRMPRSFREDFARIALACKVWKCGCAISLADAHLFSKRPYLLGLSIEDWEKQYWTKKHDDLPVGLQLKLQGWGADVYDAPVDTTFAVYHRDAPRKDFMEGVRVAGPFSCRHLPWYEADVTKSKGTTCSAGSCDDGQGRHGESSTSTSLGRKYFSTTARIKN